MSTPLCGVVLAAGYGSRLRPLTDLRPKALCPIGDVPVLDRALAALSAVGLHGPASVAVNASWLGEQIAAHVSAGYSDTAAGHAAVSNTAAGHAATSNTARATVSLERPHPFGTAGGVAHLREWIDGRGVLVGNADAYLAPAHRRPVLADLIAGWDGRTVRLLGVPAPAGTVDAFSGYGFAGFSLLPWHWVRRLPAAPEVSDLVSTVWRPAEAAGELTVVPFAGRFHDTGTVADYLAANRHAARVATGTDQLVAADAVVTGVCRDSVVGAGARVHGGLVRSVVWPGGRVAAHEHLQDAVRAETGDTVTVAGDVARDDTARDDVTRGGGATSPAPPRSGPPGAAGGPCA